MALIFADRVFEQSSTIGLGAMTLTGSLLNFQSFLDGIGVGNQTHYAIVDNTNVEWEVGVGTLTASTVFTRDTVLASSNSNAPVNFAAGVKQVFTTVAAQFFTSSLNTSAHGLIDHSLLPGIPAPATFTASGHEAIDHTAPPFSLMNITAHDGVDHKAAPFDLIDQVEHDLLSHVSAPNVNDFDLAAHDLVDHQSIDGIPLPETFTSTSHDSVDHKGSPLDILDTALHAPINHAGLVGFPFYNGVLHFGANWNGASAIYLQANGVADQTSLTIGDERTEIFMPFDGEIVGVTWNVLQASTTREMEVVINGLAVITFLLVAVRREIPPIPIPYNGGDTIEIRGRIGVGSGSPNREVVHVFVRDTST